MVQDIREINMRSRTTPRKQRAPRYAQTAGACRRCGEPIEAGDRISTARAEFAHPACVRMHVRPARETRPLAVPSTATCGGCGQLVGDEPSVAVRERVAGALEMTWWHRECRVRR